MTSPDGTTLAKQIHMTWAKLLSTQLVRLQGELAKQEEKLLELQAKRASELPKVEQATVSLGINWQELQIKAMEEEIKQIECVQKTAQQAEILLRTYLQTDKNGSEKIMYTGLIVSLPVTAYDDMVQDVMVEKAVKLTVMDVAAGHLHVNRSQATILLRVKLEK